MDLWKETQQWAHPTAWRKTNGEIPSALTPLPPKNNTVDWICNLFTGRNFKFVDARERAEILWSQFVMISAELQK